MPFLTQGKTNWKFIRRFIVFAILFLIAIVLLSSSYNPLLGSFVGILAFSFLIISFLDIFRRIRKKPETPISKEIPTIIRIFFFIICFLLCLLAFQAYPSYLAAFAFFLFLSTFGFWWLFELVSLIRKLIRRQKPTKYEIILVLISPLIIIIFVLWMEIVE